MRLNNKLTAISIIMLIALSSCKSIEDKSPSKSADTKIIAKENKVEKHTPQVAKKDSNGLEIVTPSPGTQLGSVDPYSSVSESAIDESVDVESFSLTNDYIIHDLDNISFNENISTNNTDDNEDNADSASLALNDSYQAPNHGQINAAELQDYNSNTHCNVSLNAEVSGIARSLIKELLSRLRAEKGSIYVAPTIIDSEYEDCVKDFTHAIEDGIRGNPTFILSSNNNNFNNIISQNIGSATIIPRFIHQARRENINYLVIAQIRKTGDKGALNLRIIRTHDGITLSQNYRRLSQ